MKNEQVSPNFKKSYIFSLFTLHSRLLSVLNERNTDHFFFICMAASRASCKFLFSLSAWARSLRRLLRISCLISQICPRIRFLLNGSLSRSSSCSKKRRSCSKFLIFSFSYFFFLPTKKKYKNSNQRSLAIENKLKPFLKK